MLKPLRHISAFFLAALTTFLASASGTITYFHNDLAGNPVAATNEQGQVIWRESYRPYGERTTNSAAAKDNKIWFTSRRQDAETGLIYMGARYYDPMMGRFISTDPVGFDEKNVHSFNRYAYANNNPYRYIDPDGRSPLSLAAIEIAKYTGAGYGLGVMADVVSQFAAWGSADLGLAATSNAAVAGGTAGLLTGVGAGIGRAISAADETSTLYRAVSQAELKQIQATGRFEASASSANGKYFAESAEHAATWGSKLEGAGNFSVVEAQFSKGAAESFMRWGRLDGIGPARFGEMGQINSANPAIRVLK